MALVKYKGTVNPVDIDARYLSAAEMVSDLRRMSMEIRTDKA